MVVGYLGIIHRMAVEMYRNRCSYLAQRDGYFLENILADVSAACAGIGRDYFRDKLSTTRLLIEALAYREGFVR